MGDRMTDWMRRLNELILEKDPGDNSDNSANSPPIVTNVTIVTGISSPKRPPTDAGGVPCGGCPSCGQGEFWRWPKFHPQHDIPPTGAAASAIRSRGSGPCDFCGVPDSMLKQPSAEDDT
jgi:hypothetical protein